jgi:hypothetical protein
MKVFHFDRKTWEYLGFSQADASPGDPGHFLVPAYATNVEPPSTPTGSVPVWTGSAWVVTPNMRGTRYWLGEEEHVMTILGPLPEGSMLTPAAPTAEIAVGGLFAAIQDRLDSTARDWGYDSMDRGVSYHASTVAQWSAEAHALRAWRDDLWGWAIAMATQIHSGEVVPTGNWEALDGAPGIIRPVV